MKAEELMIGNIIRAIDSKKEIVVSGSTIFEGTDGYFEGIPLTEQWLKRFGFENNKNYQGGILHRISQGYNYIHQGQLIARVPFVHSLQNLHFVLTGQKL